ncbi:MAG: succinate--CoA ligase subunit alpha [Chloroflexota bacterium]
MGILVDTNTRVVVQGLTGRQGQFHTQQMIDYGTDIVAGIRPGRGGEWSSGIPVFDTVKEAAQVTEANTSIIFVPAPNAPDAIMEAAAAGIPLIVCLTEHIPIQDMLRVCDIIDQSDSQLLGPNSPGVITPGQSKVGIMPGHIHSPGHVGVISRSSTLTYEVVQHLSNYGLGQSSVVGIGGDPIIATRFVDVLRLFEVDPLTEHVVIIGEIGGIGEQEAAKYISSEMSKPVTAFVAGHLAPVDRIMGHAGAIIETDADTAFEKVIAFEKAGVAVATSPEEVARFVKKRM